MSGPLSQDLRRKIRKLQNAQQQLETRLRTETDLEWGEEHVLQKQALLRERDYIQTQLVSLTSSLSSIENKPTSVKTLTVECAGQVKTFKVVPSHLVSPKNGLISQNSPLALALAKCQIGETVEISTPTGHKTYKLLKK